MQLDSLQQEAVDVCLDKKNRIVAVTGPAGTGKTTIIKTVAEHLKVAGVSFVLAAPTGKAARRISEVTGYDAITLHKLLEYPKPGERDPETGKALAVTEPKRHAGNPLDYQVVIADEYMMVGYELDRNIIDALGRGGRLLVFGDQFQLPPIESGSYTPDKAAFEKHIERKSVTLEFVYRQGEGSGILANANRIRKGSVPSKTEDFQISFVTNPVKAIASYVERALEQGVDFRSIQNQIIVPTRKTWIGSVALNPVLRRALLPDYDYELELPRHNWDSKNRCRVAVGDKVVCTENTYDMRNYDERYSEFGRDGVPVASTFIATPASRTMLNGETGIVDQILDDGSLQIDFGDRIVEVPSVYAEYHWKSDNVYDVDPRKRIELAYALTTHKCQGSEYQRIIYVMNKSAAFMLGKRNFYTAVTRAREHVLVATDPISLSRAVKPERIFNKDAKK